MLTFRAQHQSCSNLVLEHLNEEFLIENSLVLWARQKIYFSNFDPTLKTKTEKCQKLDEPSCIPN